MKKRRAALLTAITMLCGCSGKSDPQELTEETSTAETPPPVTTTAYTDAPAPVGVICDTSDSSQPDVSVDLSENHWTEFSNIFQLSKGSWCTVSELGADMTEYAPPIDLKRYELFDHCDDLLFFRSVGSVVLWDTDSGEIHEIYTGSGTPIAADDTYLAVRENHEIKVNKIDNGHTVVTIPEQQGNTSFAYTNYACLKYGRFYFDGAVRLLSWGTDLPAVFVCDLYSGAIKLYKTDAYAPEHGVGNVVMTISSAWKVVYNLRNQYFTDVDYDSDFFIHLQELEINELTLPRVQISFYDQDDFEHVLGTTGLGFYPLDAAMLENGLFVIQLQQYTNDKILYIIGKYDFDSGEVTAARYDDPFWGESTQVVPEDDHILLVNRQSSLAIPKHQIISIS